MARFIVDVPTPYAPQHVDAIISRFCQQEGYSPTMWKNEMLMGKGDGFIMIRQFLKVLVSPGLVHIEAWIQNMGGREQSFDGFMGWAVKGAAKKKINNLVATLNGTAQVYAVAPPVG